MGETFVIRPDPELAEDGLLVAIVEVPGGAVHCRGQEPDELIDDFLEGLRIQQEDLEELATGAA